MKEDSQKEELSGIVNFNEYFNEFEVDEENNGERATGFKELDNKQKFRSGVYALGGRPSVGKTTFVWQLLEQLAENGERCIYGTYGQRAAMIYLKSLTRKLYSYEGDSAPSLMQIVQGKRSRKFSSALTELSTEAKDLTVIELREETADDLVEMFGKFCSDDGKTPVFCIDYLEDIKRSREETETEILLKLKQFSRDTQATIILVTRINRQSYNTEVELKSFTSDVISEADVVWGLQFYATKNFGEWKKADASEILFKLSQSPSREMMLKCVKNNFGDKYEVNLKYEAAHDYFQSVEGFSERLRV